MQEEEKDWDVDAEPYAPLQSALRLSMFSAEQDGPLRQCQRAFNPAEASQRSRARARLTAEKDRPAKAR